MSFSLAQLGWKPFFQQQVTLEESEQNYLARISQIHRNHCVVWSQESIQNFEIGVFSNPKDLAVGDWMLIPHQGERPLRLLERETVLTRKAAGQRKYDQLIAANVDTLFIVTSCDQDFNASRLERYLALANEANIQPVIVLTKIDLTTDSQIYVNEALGLQKNIQVECVNAKDSKTLNALQSLCTEGHTIALVGSSGVGKSTLINQLTDAEQLTAEIREEDGKGKHTTTSRSMHLLQGGGILIDTPGIRELRLTETETGIEDTFEDVTQYFGQCKFRNCKHDSEKECAIKGALEAGELDQRRWESYQKLNSEQKITG